MADTSKLSYEKYVISFTGILFWKIEKLCKKCVKLHSMVLALEVSYTF